MKQLIKKLAIAIVIVLVVNPNIKAVVAGSENSVSIQSNTLFPAADSDNEMRAFGWFKNGFSLENSATSCIFNSIYPVSGNINMNGGTITLMQDMIFKDTIFVGSFGTFIGNNNNIDLTQAFLTGLTPPTATFQDVTLYTGGGFFVANAFTFEGTCLVDGGNDHITFLGPLAEVIIQPNATLTLANMSLQNISDTKIRCVDDTGVLILNNVSIELEDDFSFSLGSIEFLNYVDFQGSHTFIYDSTQSSTIATRTILKIFADAYLQTGRINDQTTVEPLIFTDQTSFLNLDTGNLVINSHGARFLKGTLQITNNVIVDALGSNTATGLEFGDGTLANDFNFQFDSGSLYAPNGFQIFNDLQPNILLSKVGGAVISNASGSTTYINQNQTITNFTSRANAGTQTIVAPGKTLSFNDLTVLTALGSFTITGNFVDASTNSLIGGQTITLNGALPSATLISNAGNFISGNGQILAPIILQDGNAQLLWGNIGEVSSNIILNNGTLSLMSDLSLGHAISITGPGTILLDNQNLNTGYVDYDQGISWNGDLAFDGSVGVINFNAGITLGTTWTLSGDVILVGNGNTLDLTNGELVVVGANSRLEFRNLKVAGVHDHNIRFFDDSGVLIVNNSSLFLDDNYTFSTGAIRWQNDSIIRGQNLNFIYESDQTFTVLAHSNLTVDVLVTYSYDTVSPNLFEFENRTANLVLNGGELFAAKNGLNLTVGSMQVLSAGGTFASDTSITLGDCFNSNNDFPTVISDGFIVAKGTFNYKNVLGSSWLMQEGSFWNFSDNTTLNVYQTISCGTSVTTFGLGCTLGQADLGPCPPATFNGAVSGSPSVTHIPCCS